MRLFKAIDVSNVRGVRCVSPATRCLDRTRARTGSVCFQCWLSALGPKNARSPNAFVGPAPQLFVSGVLVC